VTVTLTSEGHLIINALFRPLEKMSVKLESGVFDAAAFQDALDRLLGNVFCPGVMVTCNPDHWELPVREFEEPFRRVQSVTCPVWYSPERSEEFPISPCVGCQEVAESLGEKHETIETEIIILDSNIAEQVYEGDVSQVEIREEGKDPA
jgi:hypothetical protein